MYTIYILRCSDNTLYTGVAKDLQKRVESHRNGKGSKYVRARLPCELVYSESCADRSAAQRREYEIKQMKREEKEKLLPRQTNQDQPHSPHNQSHAEGDDEGNP
jgi:putative endonuclease